MADSAVAITAGSGTAIDTRTESTNGNHRQVVVLGDPTNNLGVAPVDVTKGLAVDLTATGQNTNPLKVDGSTVTQPVSATSLPLPTGASTAAKQPALGTAGTPSADVLTIQGITGMTPMSVKIDQTTVGTTNGVSLAQIGANTILTGNGVTGTGSQRVTVSSDNTAIANWGLGATGAAVPSGAQYNGLNASTALPTAATAGNLTGFMGDKFGRQVTLPITVRDLVGTQTTTISASTTETTVVTAAVGIFNDLVMLVVSNTSASTQTRIDFRDTTAGSVLFSLNSPGNTTIGFAPPVAIPQTTANTNWTAQCATSTTDVRVYAVYAKNK